MTYNAVDMEKGSCHGGWAKGYWEGRMSALEDIYDLLLQRMEDKDGNNRGH